MILFWKRDNENKYLVLFDDSKKKSENIIENYKKIRIKIMYLSSLKIIIYVRMMIDL